jgi:hypothetical protein
VIDPITAYLSETINTNNDASVRRATTPLADLAQRTGTTILLVRHLNKSGELKAKYRGGGSIAFTGAARAVLVVEEHPEQPGLMVLARVKNNLAKTIPGVGYRVASDELHECPLIAWEGVVHIDADTLLRGHDSRRDAESPRRGRGAAPRPPQRWTRTDRRRQEAPHRRRHQHQHHPAGQEGAAHPIGAGTR